MANHARVELDQQDAEEVEERRLPPAHVVFETIRAEGEQELERSASALLFSGLAAGLSMGFSLIASAMLSAHLPKAPWSTLVTSFGYCTGFVVVVLGRQQLFTENTLTAVLPALVDFNLDVLRKLARLWGLVLFANLAGCALVALALALAPVLRSGPEQAALLEVAGRAVGAAPLTAFCESIFAGWLIALMVWLMPAAEGGAKPLIVVGLTYLIALCGFTHIVAGSVDACYMLFRGATSLGTVLATFFGPTLCGNILGGVLMVSLLSFGQVFEDHIKGGKTDTKSPKPATKLTATKPARG